MDSSISAKAVGVVLFLGLIAAGIIVALTTGADDTQIAADETSATEAPVDAVVESDASQEPDADVEVAGSTEEATTSTSDAPSTTTAPTTSPTTTTTTTSTTTTTTDASTNAVAPTASPESTTVAAPVAPPDPAPSPPTVAPTPAPTTPPVPDISTEGDSAQDAASEAEADDDASETEGASESDSAADAEEEAAADEAATFSDQPFPGQVVFSNGEFVRVDSTGDGFELARSTNGVDWVLEPTTGLPSEGFVQTLVSSADGLVAIVEIFPDFIDPFQLVVESGLLTDEQVLDLCDVRADGPGEPIVVTVCDFEDFDRAVKDFESALDDAESEQERLEIEDAFFEFETQFFDGQEALRLEPGDAFYDEILNAILAQETVFESGPEQVIATSATGASWSTAQLPEIPVEDGGFTFINGAAVSGNQLAVLISVEPAFVDPFEALFESGLLTEDQVENICGIESGDDGDPIIVTSCDFGAADDDFEETEILRIVPGDELYDELLAAFFSEPEGSPIVLAGPIGGNLDIVDLPVEGFPNVIVGTDAGFLTTVFSFDGGPTVLRSPDGRDWAPVERFESDADGGSSSDVLVAANSDLALAIVVDFNTSPDDDPALLVLTSDDLGTSWRESEIPTELFGTFPQPVAGPGGFAALLQGTTEPFDFFGPDLIEIEQDGFIMEIRLNEDSGGLRSIDGTVIHESVSFEEAFAEGEIPGVLRIEQPNEDAAWLDPETGDVLTVFSFEDITNAIDQAFEQFDGPESEPTFESELWFSPDGETWTLLATFVGETQDEFTSIAAVGDDEVVLLTESFPVPPDELFIFEEEGREPTLDELAALDAFFAEQPAFEWSAVPTG